MTALAARVYQASKSEIVFAGNAVRIGDRQIDFAELAKTCFLERVSLSSTGYFATPKITWDRDTASGQPFLYFAYGAACTGNHSPSHAASRGYRWCGACCCRRRFCSRWR